MAEFGGASLPWETLLCAHNKCVIFPTLRSRKRKQEEEEEDYDDEDIDKNEEEEYDLSDEEDAESYGVDSSDDEDEIIDDEGDNRAKPAVRNRYFWNNVTDQSSFQTVDGADKLFRRYYDGRTRLHWNTRGVLSSGQRALVSKQRTRTIKLERVFGRSSKLTQVPYRELSTFIFFYFITLY